MLGDRQNGDQRSLSDQLAPSLQSEHQRTGPSEGPNAVKDPTLASPSSPSKKNSAESYYESEGDDEAESAEEAIFQAKRTMLRDFASRAMANAPRAFFLGSPQVKTATRPGQAASPSEQDNACVEPTVTHSTRENEERDVHLPVFPSGGPLLKPHEADNAPIDSDLQSGSTQAIPPKASNSVPAPATPSRPEPDNPPAIDPIALTPSANPHPTPTPSPPPPPETAVALLPTPLTKTAWGVSAIVAHRPLVGFPGAFALATRWDDGSTTWEPERSLQLQLPDLVYRYWDSVAGGRVAAGRGVFRVFAVLRRCVVPARGTRAARGRRMAEYEVQWEGFPDEGECVTVESEAKLKRIAPEELRLFKETMAEGAAGRKNGRETPEVNGESAT